MENVINWCQHKCFCIAMAAPATAQLTAIAVKAAALERTHKSWHYYYCICMYVKWKVAEYAQMYIRRNIYILPESIFCCTHKAIYIHINTRIQNTRSHTLTHISIHKYRKPRKLLESKMHSQEQPKLLISHAFE